MVKVASRPEYCLEQTGFMALNNSDSRQNGFSHGRFRHGGNSAPSLAILCASHVVVTRLKRKWLFADKSVFFNHRSSFRI